MSGHERCPGGMNPSPTVGGRFAAKVVGAASPTPRGGAVWLPVDGRPRKARQNPSGLAGSASSPLRGAPFAWAKPAREASPSGEVAAKQAGRVQPVDGGHSKVAGRACPAPTDCRESLCTRGAREGGSPPPAQLAGGCPGTGGDARPVGIPQAANAASPL